MDEKTAVALEKVVKRFGDVLAVDGISLEVEHGQFVVFIGPSGCGKTTTLRLIAGLEQPTEGSIVINGRPMNGVKPWERDTPLVWQNFALFPYLNVSKNVAFGLKMRKVDKQARRSRVRQALERVGIAELADRPISQLSGGQKQRVGLARALVTDPKVLLLDEPLGSLDAHLKVRMQSELRLLQQELGITFIYVTHNQSEALAMADRIVVMDLGKIRQVGAPQEVYRRPRDRFVAEFVGTNNIFSGEVAAVEGKRVTVSTPAGPFTVDAANGRHAVGEPATFVIAADRIRTAFEGELAENRLTGTVTGQEFIGAVATLFLALDDGSEFRIQKQEHQLARISAGLGEHLEVSWEPTEAFLLPNP
jgi:spermidine/putrescine transport system ATP-binding protein